MLLVLWGTATRKRPGKAQECARVCEEEGGGRGGKGHRTGSRKAAGKRRSSQAWNLSLVKPADKNRPCEANSAAPGSHGKPGLSGASCGVPAGAWCRGQEEEVGPEGGMQRQETLQGVQEDLQGVQVGLKPSHAFQVAAAAGPAASRSWLRERVGHRDGRDSHHVWMAGGSGPGGGRANLGASAAAPWISANCGRVARLDGVSLPSDARLSQGSRQAAFARLREP